MHAAWLWITCSFCLHSIHTRLVCCDSHVYVYLLCKHSHIITGSVLSVVANADRILLSTVGTSGTHSIQTGRLCTICEVLVCVQITGTRIYRHDTAPGVCYKRSGKLWVYSYWPDILCCMSPHDPVLIAPCRQQVCNMHIR